MAKFPTYEEMAKNIAEKALDEFLYDGKSIREWMQIIASEDCISRQEVLDAIDSKAWEFCDYLISKGRNDEQKPVSHFADNLRECVREELPSVTPQPCDDAVSRAESQTKIEIMHKYQQLEDFAKWVAVEVIDEELWTYNHLSFAEIACRKLVQLGIMQESDGEYSYEVIEDDKR